MPLQSFLFVVHTKLHDKIENTVICIAYIQTVSLNTTELKRQNIYPVNNAIILLRFEIKPRQKCKFNSLISMTIHIHIFAEKIVNL